MEDTVLIGIIMIAVSAGTLLGAAVGHYTALRAQDKRQATLNKRIEIL